MRPSGILLVLILCCACASQGYSSYDNSNELEQAPSSETSVDNNNHNNNINNGNNITTATTNNQPQEEGSTSNNPQKRDQLGMPRELTSSSLTGATSQQQADEGSQASQQQQQQPPVAPQSAQELSEPVNSPALVSEARAFGVGGGSEQASPEQSAPAENLPKIIEKNSQVYPKQEQQQQQQSSPSNSDKGPSNGQQLSNTDLTAPSANLTMPQSTARTFDSWTNCVGAQSNKYGTCKNDVECNKSKGRADGSCMGGFGVCCVVALSCGDKSIENNTFFANPDFPDGSWEARQCEVELKKKGKHILQIMIEFEEFDIAPPNHEGECLTDVFQVKLASNRPSPYSLLRICGQNTGQHMYLDVSQIDEPLVLSVATSGGGYPRRWSIRIVQMDDKNFLLAPPGCLQYYTDTVGHFRSFNLGKNLKNLYYAICFRIDNGYSGLRFTENFFGMNGPFCRKRIGAGGMARYNGSVVAHPHHLVIPPPGYATPLPRPPPKYIPQEGHQYQGGQYQSGNSYQQQQQLPPPPPPPTQQQLQHQQRFKRLAYAEADKRETRTVHEHDKAFEHEKEFKHHEERPYPPPPPPNYGGSSYNYPPPPPPPPPSYSSGEYYSPKGEYKDKLEDKFFYENKHHPHEHEPTKVLSWKDKLGGTFGWVGAKSEDKFESKYDGKYENNYGNKYNQGYGQTYGSPGYGGGHLKQHGYGGMPPPPPPQHYHHHQQGYGGGEYHHKEIDKFGKQYEQLEYKHEKNHHLGHEKEKSSWWPSWGKKEEKKLEKFQQHHEALFPMMHIPEMPHCEPRFCGHNDIITFPPSGDSISEMCGNRFNRGRGPKIISGSPLVVYVSNKGHNRGAGFDMNYEQVFYIPRPY